mmetsp:Transcript_14229/g.18637  ORF Transcript_14229/g.18637 Transcript_14229/m.18637 type:complete len:431 (-) Transcript_14229:1505-2797(-)
MDTIRRVLSSSLVLLLLLLANFRCAMLLNSEDFLNNYSSLQFYEDVYSSKDGTIRCTFCLYPNLATKHTKLGNKRESASHSKTPPRTKLRLTNHKLFYACLDFVKYSHRRKMSVASRLRGFRPLLESRRYVRRPATAAFRVWSSFPFYADSATCTRQTFSTDSASGKGDRILGIKAYRAGSEKEYTVSENTLAEKQLLLRTLYRDGAIEQAEAVASECVEISKALFGEEHPVYASSLNNLALLSKEKGDYEKAIETYSKAIKVYKDLLGYEHQSTVTAMNNLAETYKTYADRSTGMLKHQLYVNSLDLLEEVVELRKKLDGESSHLTGSTMQTMGRVLYSIGRKDDAASLIFGGAKIIENSVGKEDSRTATAWNNIGYHLKVEGSFDEALRWYEKAYKLRFELLGPSHTQTIVVKNNMVSWLLIITSILL